MDFEHHKLEQCPDLSGFHEKGRAFSTSTPVVHSKLSDSLPPRSLSSSAWSPNDSGYGDSLCSSSAGDDTCQVTPTASRDSFISFRLTGLDLSPSPTSTITISGSQQTDKHVPRFSLGIHTLDFEIPEEEQVFEKFSPNKTESPIPHYSLEDEAEDMSTEESGTSSAPSSSSTIQTSCSNLTDRFNAVLQQCMPKVPDRMIGRKMGLEKVDLIHELDHRGMGIIIEKIVSYLQASDIRRLVNDIWWICMQIFYRQDLGDFICKNNQN